MAQVREEVCFRKIGEDGVSTFASCMAQGIFVGHHDRTGTVLCFTKNGVCARHKLDTTGSWFSLSFVQRSRTHNMKSVDNEPTRTDCRCGIHLDPIIGSLRGKTTENRTKWHSICGSGEFRKHAFGQTDFDLLFGVLCCVVLCCGLVFFTCFFRRWGPEGWGAQKFALFSPSP